MTLMALLKERIQQSGPLTIAEYMSECLLHPKFGYYAVHEPFGTKGDFVTAPEINQMFGELLGLSLAQTWVDQGRPDHFTLAELGPGRGTLLLDALRATQKVPGFHEAAQIHLVEASSRLRKVQAETLREYSPVWLDDTSRLPDAPLFLVANEFFDALPVRQFIRTGSGWTERLVGLSADTETLTFGRGAQAEQAALALRLEDTRDGDLVEICEAAPGIMREVAERIAGHGGVALVIDYGDWRSVRDTFQAMANHEFVNPLLTPGRADLTAHVDFEALAGAVKAVGCNYSRLTTQGVFLERLGITARARTLANQSKDNQLESLIRAHRRLTHPEEMGNLFKVLGVFPARTSPPPGLET